MCRSPSKTGDFCGWRPAGRAASRSIPSRSTRPLAIWIDARQIVGVPFASTEIFRGRLNDTAYRPLMFEVEPLGAEGERRGQNAR